MIVEYYEKFNTCFSYIYLNRKLVFDFEDYLLEHNIGVNGALDCIDEFTDCLSVSTRTRRHYRTLLRRFVEWLVEEKKV